MDTDDLIRRLDAQHAEIKAHHTKTDSEMGDMRIAVAPAAACTEARRRRRRLSEPEHKSWGQTVAESPELADLIRKGRGIARVKIAPEYATKATLLSSGGAGGMVPPHTVLEPAVLARRRLRVRDLLSPGRTESNVIKFTRMTARSDNAAPTSESATKPEASLDFELVSEDVATIANWIPASRQILDDAPMLQSTIDSELRYAVQLAEESQLLNGDGSGVNLHGIIPQATAYAAPFTPTSPQALDTIALARAQLQAAEFEVSGIVMNPLDVGRLMLLKDGENRYLSQGPFSAEPFMIWGVPVVASNSMAQDKFLIGDFRRAVLFDRQDLVVEVSTEDSDNFRKNLVTIPAEERLRARPSSSARRTLQ